MVIISKQWPGEVTFSLWDLTNEKSNQQSRGWSEVAPGCDGEKTVGWEIEQGRVKQMRGTKRKDLVDASSKEQQ